MAYKLGYVLEMLGLIAGVILLVIIAGHMTGLLHISKKYLLI